MAQSKNYNNFTELVGNVANEPRVSEKTNDMRFTIATHHTYTKKDGTKETETIFLNVHLRPKRKFAKQESVIKGAFLRILGHLENNSYVDASGHRRGGMEIGADKIVVLHRRKDGSIENTETGEVETIEQETIDNA